MTDQELKDIVAAVVAELEKSGVDFDYKAQAPEDSDLVFVIRGTAPDYQGVTVTWKGLLDIITAQATQAKTDAVNAKDIAQQILTQVQNKGAEITNFVTTSKAEIETQKNESVEEVRSVYTSDLNELKGDLSNLENAVAERTKNIFNNKYNGTVNGVTFTNGLVKGYHPSSAGVFTEATGENMTYPIEVEAGKTIYIYKLNDNGVLVLTSTSRSCFYDKDMNYIMYSYATGKNTVTAPDNAKYVVFSCAEPTWQVFGDDVPSMVSYEADLKEYEEHYDGVKPLLSQTDLIELENRINSEMNGFNSADYEVGYDWKTKVSEFSALFNDTNTIETFCFFTDPHLFELNGGFQMNTFEPYMSILQKVVNSSPCDFVMCGGDWLNNGDTKAQACFNLGYVDGVMRTLFRKHHQMVGNHDTNYQGYEYIQDNTKYRDCMLSDNTIRNLWFREEGERYYSFNGNNCKYYVLDTGIDWWDWITEDRKAQMDWLSSKLIADNPTHATIFMHITLNANGVLGENAKGIEKIITAFNNHTKTESINGTYYDFTGTTGHIDYVMSGHTHSDNVTTIGGVPLIVTTNFTNNNTPTFDLVIVDYDNNVLKTVRVGNGSNRTVDI